ncbi:MAG: hypothetical protein RL764_661 [Pseudomonadota bacterium]
MTHMPSSRSLVSGREMFSAFVSDDHAINALYQICSEFGWSSDVVYPGGLHNAVQTLAVSSSPSILFVDISQAQNPLSDINSLAEVCEPGTIVIACGHLNDVRLYRDLLASGIQDYLLMPLNPDQLRDAFAHAQASPSRRPCQTKALLLLAFWACAGDAEQRLLQQGWRGRSRHRKAASRRCLTLICILELGPCSWILSLVAA